jgi:UDP-N-acetylglucosamine 2-epimerase
MKVCTILGTRPEIIRLSRVIPVLDKNFDHTLIHTGQNYDYELNQIFFDELGLRKPDILLSYAHGTAIQTVGDIMYWLEVEFTEYKPDAILILGDTNSCVAAAYVAKRLKIPLFHMEAGNRAFDERIPEEINRRIIDHIADVNLPYSDIARECLLREGLPIDRTIKTGSPVAEVLKYYQGQIYSSKILQKLNLKENDYFVVSVHREENVGTAKGLYKIVKLLYELAEKFEKRIIVSAHPRLGIKKLDCPEQRLVEFHKPFGFFDYVKLQQNAIATLSDSGSITEESAILNFPALNLREAQERHEGMEEAAVPLVGFDIDRVMKGLEFVARYEQQSILTPMDYQNDNVSEKIARIILSYTDYVNRKVYYRA